MIPARAAVATVDAYVGTMARMLPGPRDARAALLRELSDGLHDATCAYQAAGLSRAEAERRAVEESGAPVELVPHYREVLATTQGRRTAMLFALSAPASTLAWNVVWDLPGNSMSSPPSLALLCFRLIDWATLIGGAVAVAGLGLLVLAARFRWSYRRVIATQAIVGAVSVLVTLTASLLGNASSLSLWAKPVSLPAVVAVLGVGSLAMMAWQFASAWQSLRAVRT